MTIALPRNFCYAKIDANQTPRTSTVRFGIVSTAKPLVNSHLL